MCEIFPKLELVPSQAKKYPHMPKITSGCLPVSSINSVHINIYSQHPVTRTLRGNPNLFEIANIRVNERNL